MAALSAISLAFVASGAYADPIGRPWSSGGAIALDDGLSGTSCRGFVMAGAVNGNSATSVSFAGCSGSAGTPSALVPWAITWNGTNTGGSILVRELKSFLGLASCLYQGAVAFTFASLVITIVPSNVTLVAGAAICPRALTWSGSIAVR